MEMKINLITINEQDSGSSHCFYSEGTAGICGFGAGELLQSHSSKVIAFLCSSEVKSHADVLSLLKYSIWELSRILKVRWCLSEIAL